MKGFWLFSLFLIVSCNSPYEDQSIDLTTNPWFYTFSNDRSFLDADWNSSKFETVKLPKNLSLIKRDHKGFVYLRKNVEISKKEVNWALELGQTYSTDEIFWNATKLYKSDSELGYGRPRIYPIPNELVNNGENWIVIKVESEIQKHLGIESGPIRLVPHGQALYEFNLKNLYKLAISSVAVFVSLFFFLAYIRDKENDAYLKFAGLVFLFSIYQFTKNEIRFWLNDSFATWKWIEYNCILFFPYLWIRFLQGFLGMRKIPMQRLYLFFPFIFSVTFLVYPKPVFWVHLVMYWEIHLIVLFGLALWITTKKTLERTPGAFLQLISMLYLLIAIITEIWRGNPLTNSNSAVLKAYSIYLITIVISLRVQFLLQNRKIHKRFLRLKEADFLREKIFSYMDTLISGPLREMREKISYFKEKRNKEEIKVNLSKLFKLQNQIENNVDDVMELARLEVLSEAPSKTKIQFYDFVKVLMPQTKITYALNLDTNLEIETSIELLNSCIIRMISFPVFAKFKHMDLVITEDLKGYLHFRFLLFHPNRKIAKRVLEDLNFVNHELDPVRVKWAILLELKRLLEGDLISRTIRNNYLKVDLAIPTRKSIHTYEMEKSTNYMIRLTSVIRKIRISFLKPKSRA